LISNLGSQIDSINGFLIKILEFLISKFCFWTRFKFLIFTQKPPKRNLLLKKPISFFKMGPVNFRNPNFSFSVQSTVKNTILDRAFTRLFKISIARFETKILDLWTILDSEFSFLRRDNSYFQFYRIPIMLAVPHNGLCSRSTQRSGVLSAALC
jgi:hypothetical protein